MCVCGREHKGENEKEKREGEQCVCVAESTKVAENMTKCLSGLAGILHDPQ